MDDEEIFGPVLHRLTFGEAIAQGLLQRLPVVVVGTDERHLPGTRLSGRLSSSRRRLDRDRCADTGSSDRPGQGHRNLRAPPFHHLPLSSASGPALRPEPARFSPTGWATQTGCGVQAVSGEMVRAKET